jgi:hypothetical protein
VYHSSVADGQHAVLRSSQAPLYWNEITFRAPFRSTIERGIPALHPDLICRVAPGVPRDALAFHRSLSSGGAAPQIASEGGGGLEAEVTRAEDAAVDTVTIIPVGQVLAPGEVTKNDHFEAKYLRVWPGWVPEQRAYLGFVFLSAQEQRIIAQSRIVPHPAVRPLTRATKNAVGRLLRPRRSIPHQRSI